MAAQEDPYVGKKYRLTGNFEILAMPEGKSEFENIKFQSGDIINIYVVKDINGVKLYIADGEIGDEIYGNIIIEGIRLELAIKHKLFVEYEEPKQGGKRRKYRKTRHRKMKRSKTTKRKVRR